MSGLKSLILSDFVSECIGKSKINFLTQYFVKGINYSVTKLVRRSNDDSVIDHMPFIALLLRERFRPVPPSESGQLKW